MSKLRHKWLRNETRQWVNKDLHPPAPEDFFLLFFVLSFLLNNIVHDFTRSKCSRSVYWYIQGFPLVPLELTSDSRDILAERRYLSTKSQSASTASWMSALYRREYLVENLLLYCHDISRSRFAFGNKVTCAGYWISLVEKRPPHPSHLRRHHHDHDGHDDHHNPLQDNNYIAVKDVDTGEYMMNGGFVVSMFQKSIQ